MPTPYLKKLSKEQGVPIGEAEQKWEDAKEAAQDQGKGENYGYITEIFKRMMGVTGSAGKRPSFAKPDWKMDRWKDRSTNNWVVRVLDGQGYQVGDAIVVYRRDEAMAIDMTHPSLNIPTGREDEELEKRYGMGKNSLPKRFRSSFIVRAFLPKLLSVRDRLTVKVTKTPGFCFFIVEDDGGVVRATRYGFRSGSKFSVGELCRSSSSSSIPVGVPVDKKECEKMGWFPLPPHDTCQSLSQVKEWAIRAGIRSFLSNNSL